MPSVLEPSQWTMNDKQTQVVEKFISGLRKGGPRCLWVSGQHGAGSSTFVRKAAEIVTTEAPDLIGDLVPQRCTAQRFEDLQREVWKSEKLLLASPDDYELWRADATLVDKWKSLWSDCVLFIDDLYDEHMSFWRKYLVVRFNEQLKSRITFVAGTVAPQAFGTEWGVSFGRYCLHVGTKPWWEDGER